MAYQTVRDVVEHVRSLHSHLRRAAKQVKPKVGDHRSALLLEFIDQHEAALERAVQATTQRGGDTVLDTWLQFEQDKEVDRAMRRSENPSPSDDDVVAQVLETENALIRLYQLLQGSTSAPSVQAFFESLLEMEDSAVRRSARVKLEAHDF